VTASGIQVADLSFRYLGRKPPALRQVSFQVPRGGCALVLGPSGCGKSTLALCLNGGIPHFVEGELRGSVRIDGRDTREASMAEMAQRVGVVFQDPEAQFCMLTVEDEVAFGLENLAVPRDKMDARIDEALDAVGLLDRRRDSIEHLSGGQKQRLALACVLALRPAVLVFDEPTAQLDPAAAADVVDVLGELRSRGQHTLVVIEHRLDELMPLVDQVVVLNHAGELVADGPPREVLENWGGWLAKAGVWVPQVSELATTLATRYCGMPLEPFPLTVDEATRALSARGLCDPHEPSSSQHGALACAQSRTPVCTRRGTEVFASARHLSYRYPGANRDAVEDVSLEIRAGEITAVVGANGAGKSTLARSLVGLLRTAPGQVSLRGSVGYVFQYPEHQFIGRSVLDDVAFGVRRAGASEAESENAAHALLEEFGLERLAQAHPFALSHGEQRRLSVAAMLALGQQGLFLDEPTFGQDRRNAYLLFEKMRMLAKAGRAIVAITHDMRLVAEVADRVVVMADGRIVFEGTPTQLFADPELLSAAGLRPPPVTRLGQNLGLSGTVLSVDALVEAIDSVAVAAR
jgi:energy-coupling factor transport system ATP-binding protein